MHFYWKYLLCFIFADTAYLLGTAALLLIMLSKPLAIKLFPGKKKITHYENIPKYIKNLQKVGFKVSILIHFPRQFQIWPWFFIIPKFFNQFQNSWTNFKTSCLHPIHKKLPIFMHFQPILNITITLHNSDMFCELLSKIGCLHALHKWSHLHLLYILHKLYFRSWF